MGKSEYQGKTLFDELNSSICDKHNQDEQVTQLLKFLDFKCLTTFLSTSNKRVSKIFATYSEDVFHKLKLRYFNQAIQSHTNYRK